MFRTATLVLAATALAIPQGAHGQVLSAACTWEGGRLSFTVEIENVLPILSEANATLRYSDKPEPRKAYALTAVGEPILIVVVALDRPNSMGAFVRDTYVIDRDRGRFTHVSKSAFQDGSRSAVLQKGTCAAAR